MLPGRKSNGPRYFKSKNGWFATIKGERTRLTTGAEKATKELAWELYRQLAATRAVEVQGDRSETGAVLNAYLRDAKRRLAGNTFRNHLACISDFINFEFEPGRKIGAVACRDMKTDHVDAWIDSRKRGRVVSGRLAKWSENFVHLQKRILRTAFRWAVGDGELISDSVFTRKGKRVKLGRQDKTLKRLAITDEEHAALLAKARRRKKGDFADLLELLYHTGARPAEMYLARADEWHPHDRAIVINVQDPATQGRVKNRSWLLARGENRVISIPPHLVATVEKLCRKYPAGTLFRKEDGTPWELPKGEDGKSESVAGKIADRMKSLVQATNGSAGREIVRPAISLYGYRHAYISRWLKDGGNERSLCQLLNTSRQMIEDHYSHLREDRRAAQEEADKFAASRVLVTNPEPTSPGPSSDGRQAS